MLQKSSQGVHSREEEKQTGKAEAKLGRRQSPQRAASACSCRGSGVQVMLGRVPPYTRGDSRGYHVLSIESGTHVDHRVNAAPAESVSVCALPPPLSPLCDSVIPNERMLGTSVHAGPSWNTIPPSLSLETFHHSSSLIQMPLLCLRRLP